MTAVVRSSRPHGESSEFTRVQNWVWPKSTVLPTFTRPARAASLSVAGTPSSRLASSTSTVGTMSGSLATIFSFDGGKKWIIRDGLTGISRSGSGAPTARGRKKSLGFRMTQNLPLGNQRGRTPRQLPPSSFTRNPLRCWRRSSAARSSTRGRRRPERPRRRGRSTRGCGRRRCGRPGAVAEVGRQALGRGQAGALPHQQHHDLGPERVADVVEHPHPAVADEEGTPHGPAAIGGAGEQERAAARGPGRARPEPTARRPRPPGGRRQAVHSTRSRSCSPGGQAAAEVGAGQVLRRRSAPRCAPRTGRSLSTSGAITSSSRAMASCRASRAAAWSARSWRRVLVR